MKVHKKQRKNIKTNWDYSKLASHYDQRADYSKKLIKRILIKINCKPFYPVADIGAGTAKLSKLLCNHNLILSAVEPNDNMRNIGIKNTKSYTNISWSTGVGEKTLLRSNSYYCVFFGSSFNTVNYSKTIKEIKRIVIERGYFCCLWNHRNLRDTHQKKIENIIKNFIPMYNYGKRRLNYKKILLKEKAFTNVKKLSTKFVVTINKNDFINAWKSHGTLRKNCQNSNQFHQVINEISTYVSSIKTNYIKVPYETVAYIARLK